MGVRQITDSDRAKVKTFFEQNWGSTKMVISSGVYDCETLEGFLFEENQSIAGLVTYTMHTAEIEMISLDSVLEGRGIGSSLISEVEKVAQKNRLRTISLVTTNDNLQALKFYQKRGYRIDQVYSDAVEKARKIKPSIPLVGYGGIPIHDEIRLIKYI